MRIDLWIELAGYALDHGDAENALAIVNRAKLIAGACTEVRLVARLARLRYVVGDHDKAHAEADTALGLYEEQRDQILDIYRAGVLRPLAEAYQAMGDTAAARRVYARALEEGVGNPNARPRAEDLVATCLSMVRNGCEPDADLKARMYEIYGKLGEPW
jgi:tetratricopeptide (TPR) repeat protein